MFRSNFDAFGFQLEALYEHANSRFPSVDTPLGPAQNFTQQSVTVPAYLLLRSAESADAAFVGVGGYYSYAFDHKYSTADPGWAINPHQGGIAAVFGIKAYGLLVQWSFRSQLGSLFSGDVQQVRLKSASYITLGWFF